MIISYEKFVDDFEPYTNTMSDDRGYNNTMYETFSPEIDHVKAQNPEYIWTLIDGENNNSWIIPGFHFVNRLGYFITKNPWTDEDLLVNDNELIPVNKCPELGFDFIEKVLSINRITIKDNWMLSMKFTAFYMAEYAEDDGCMAFYITENDFKAVLTEYIEDVLGFESDTFDDLLADYQINYAENTINIRTITLNPSSGK